VNFCQMRQAIYGLKQAPGVWNKMFHKFLLSIGFTRSKADHCLYTHFCHDGNFVILIVYVDDMLQVSNHIPSLCHFQVQLIDTQFDMTNIGPAEYILGIQIIQDHAAQTVQLCQAVYIEEICKCSVSRMPTPSH
jgi:hypothetical protein